jgi:hypothetical protein
MVFVVLFISFCARNQLLDCDEFEELVRPDLIQPGRTELIYR